MIRRVGLHFAVILASGILMSGCASALREPPEVSQLVGEGNNTADTSTDALALLDEASRLFGLRRDTATVDRARRFFLEGAALDESCFKCFLGASNAIAWLIEHDEDAIQREKLAIEGVQVGQLCVRAFPDAPECRYTLARAVGQQARERPSTGPDGVKVMVDLLEQLIIEAPELDLAGPYRVLALVLLRAPGWPAGPGDPEYGLSNAQAAVDLFPDHPPNQLVLGEALVENGEEIQGRRVYEKAVALATKLAENSHPEAAEWIREGAEALDDLR